ncbi:hypothetical protein ACFQL7_27680 [Halocatena marina]|uniref:Uncharacterized protein n=1 Tax=Halocatena marina TaxID=2934937 RepID=A0ABD5YWG4_9EURY
MTRRHHAVIVLVIAVGLFVAPLISPVPNYDSRLGYPSMSLIIFQQSLQKRAGWRI